LRLRSVLDLWLVVVLFAFIIELTLSVYPSPARFTAGWYGSRVYALLYSSLVLLMLLIETTKLYGRLLDAVLAQRREHQRQVAMDAMAAGMAHELKQPLAAIANDGNAGLRFIAMSDLDEARACFEGVVSSAHRASEVIDGIRSLYKKDIRARAWLDVNEVVHDVLRMVDADLRTQQVSVSIELRDGLPPLLANRAQLEEVLLNLIANAIEAMDALTDRARLLRIGSDIIQERSAVVVTVEDSGMGIDD
jgi:C4-dicarboxylate-specific signal transduction histidine kinase